MINKEKKIKSINSFKRLVLIFGTIFFLLAAIAIPGNRVARQEARKKACISNMRTIEGVYEMFIMDHPDNLISKLSLKIQNELKKEVIEISQTSILGRELIKQGYLKVIPKCLLKGVYYIRNKKNGPLKSDKAGQSSTNKFSTNRTSPFKSDFMLEKEAYCTEHNTINAPNRKKDSPIMTNVVKKYASKIILVSLLMTLMAIIRARAFSKQTLLQNSAIPLYIAMVLSLVPLWVIILYFKTCFTGTLGLGHTPLIFFIISYFLNFANAAVFVKCSSPFIEKCMKNFLIRLVILTIIPGLICYLFQNKIDIPDSNKYFGVLFMVSSIIAIVNIVTQPVSHFFESWKALVEINCKNKI